MTPAMLHSRCQLTARKERLITNAMFSTRHGLPRTSLQNIEGKAVCLICGTQVAAFNDSNLNRHDMTKHEDEYRSLSYEAHMQESDALLTKLQLAYKIAQN